MRVICQVVGNSTCFVLQCSTQKGHGFDIPATALFAQSLCHSINRQMEVCAQEFKGLIGDEAQYKTNVSRITRNLVKERHGMIYVDIGAERRKGKQVAVCRITTDDSDCDVKTSNLLPEVARFVYKTIFLLRKMEAPKGMDILRHMEIIRDFFDPKAKTHELYIENGTVKEREKTNKKNEKGNS